MYALQCSSESLLPGVVRFCLHSRDNEPRLARWPVIADVYHRTNEKETVRILQAAPYRYEEGGKYEMIAGEQQNQLKEKQAKERHSRNLLVCMCACVSEIAFPPQSRKRGPVAGISRHSAPKLGEKEP